MIRYPGAPRNVLGVRLLRDADPEMMLRVLHAVRRGERDTDWREQVAAMMSACVALLIRSDPSRLMQLHCLMPKADRDISWWRLNADIEEAIHRSSECLEGEFWSE